MEASCDARPSREREFRKNRLVAPRREEFQSVRSFRIRERHHAKVLSTVEIQELSEAM